MQSRVIDTYIRFTLWGLAGNGLVLIGSIFMGDKEAHLTRVLVLAVTVLLSVFLVILSFQSEMQDASLRSSRRRRDNSRKRLVIGNSPYVRIFSSLVIVSVEYLFRLVQVLWHKSSSLVLSNQKTRICNENSPTQISFFEEVASSTEKNQRARYLFRKGSAIGQNSMMGRTQLKSDRGVDGEKTRIFEFSEQVSLQSSSVGASPVSGEEKTKIFSDAAQLVSQNQSRSQQKVDSSDERTEIRYFPNKQLVNERTRIKFD